MSTKHADPEWHRTARLIRAQVRRAHDNGQEVSCWRCGRPLPEDADGRLVFDVGHIDRLGDNTPSNAAPEHRGENRREGGRVGARMTNAKHGKPTFQGLPWA